MTISERNELAEIRKAMNDMNEEFVSSHWDRYLQLQAKEDEEYRNKNQESFNKFYEEHIKGRSWNEIDPEDWDFYSDWHKDMYGYRPRSIERVV